MMRANISRIEAPKHRHHPRDLGKHRGSDRAMLIIIAQGSYSGVTWSCAIEAKMAQERTLKDRIEKDCATRQLLPIGVRGFHIPLAVGWIEGKLS
jgi:hypothetical protein